MNRYQCADCHKTFIHPAIRVTNNVSIGMNTAPIMSSFEAHACPFCQSLNLEEFVESKPNVVDVVSVDFTEVPNHYNRGYRVHAIYAKEVIMTLTKKEESS